jgi:lysozyme family protein
MTGFDRAFAIVVGHEGAYTNDDRDGGNWTSGRCGVGECRGTMFGISAAAYPALDIPSLTLDAARGIYRRDYWDRLDGDDLPPQVAVCLFDTAVNSGVLRAVRWLQITVGAPCDGVMGPGTRTALHATIARDGIDSVCADFLALRLVALTQLATWPIYGSGWARRICRLAYQSARMEKTA